MINKRFFQDLLQSYQTYNESREEIIRVSRTILRRSKQAIFSLHRDDIKGAEASLNEAEKLLQDLETEFQKDKRLRYEGSYREAAEEFIEAKMFFEFVVSNRIDFQSKIKFSDEEYLDGICDLTGEILRKAIQLATEGKLKELENCKKACQLILGELVKFDLVGRLRPKYDEAKRNIRKLEEIVYEVGLKRK